MNLSTRSRGGGLLAILSLTALAAAAIAFVPGLIDNASTNQDPGKATVALPIVITSASLDPVDKGDIDIDQGEQRDAEDTEGAGAGESVVVGSELYEIIGGNVAVFDMADPTAPVFRARSSGVVIEDLFSTSLGVFAAEARALTVTDPVSGATLEDERGTRLRRVWLEGSVLAMGEGADVVGIVTAMTVQADVVFIATAWESAVPNLGEDQAPSPMTGLLSAALDDSNALAIRELVRPSSIAAMASVGTSLYVLEEPSAEEAFAIGFPLTYRLRSLDSSFDPPRPGIAEIEFTQGWGNETELMAAGDGRLVVAVDRLYAVDLSSSDAMRVEGSWEMSGPPTALALAGDEVVVATGFEEESSIERLALDPGGQWRELETITPEAAVFSLARLDKHLLATGNDGMSMWGVGGDGSSIQVAGPALTRDWYVDVAANTSHAFALDHWGEVVILKRSGDDLERVSSTVIDSQPYETGVAIDADEDHVAVALSGSVLVFRILEPAGLELVDRFTGQPGGPNWLFPQDISISGNNVAVSNGSEGVMIFGLADGALTLRAELPAAEGGSFAATAVEVDGPILFDLAESSRWLRRTDISAQPVELDRLMVEANAVGMSLANSRDRMILTSREGDVMVVDVASIPMTIVHERSADVIRWVVGMAESEGRVVTVSNFDPGIRMFTLEGDAIGDQPVNVDHVVWALACTAMDGAFLISRGNELLLIEVVDGLPVVVDDMDLAG